MAADPDWVGDETLELDDADTLKLSTGWTDLEWVLLYADADGNKIGADSGTANVQIVFKQNSGQGVTDGDAEAKYWRGATQTGISAGVLQNGDSKAGGRSLRPEVRATVRFTGAITSPPAAAITAQIWAQEI